MHEHQISSMVSFDLLTAGHSPTTKTEPAMSAAEVYRPGKKLEILIPFLLKVRNVSRLFHCP